MKQKVQYSAAEEQELMTNLWSPIIADDPEAFVMFAFPWGVKGTPLAKFDGPRRWQRRVLRKIRKHIQEQKDIDLNSLLRLARSSGRGIGKSALVSWLILWFVTTRIGGTVIVSANTEDQLRKITWAELNKWKTMAINSHWWDVVGITLKPARWLTEAVERDLNKGTEYWGADGKLWSEENPDAYAGVHNQDGVMVIFDEASGIPDAIWAVANGFFTEPTPNRFWFAFSQGRRNSGYFFEIFNKKRELWDNQQIDARFVEGTDPAVYQEIIDEYGEDSDEARIEVYGMFPDDDDVIFIPQSLVLKAIGRVNIQDPNAPIAMGIDPSRGGVDKFCILVRQGRFILEIIRFSIADSEIGTMQGVGYIIDALEEYDPDGGWIDAGGLGGPIYDRLKELGWGKLVKPIDFGWRSSKPKLFGNKRAELWGAVKRWLATATLPDNKYLKTDLSAPKKDPDGKGVMFLESKKKMKARGLASPDTGDALALTFAGKLRPRKYNKRKNNQARRVQTPRGQVAGSWMGA